MWQRPTSDIRRRVNLAWVAYRGLRDVYIHISLKRKTIDQCVLPVFINGMETCTPISASALRVAQRRMERSILRVILRGRKHNENIRSSTGVTDVFSCVGTLKWKWAGYIARLRDKRWTRILLEWRPRADTRSRGQPPTCWFDDIKRVSNNWFRIERNGIS